MKSAFPGRTFFALILVLKRTERGRPLCGDIAGGVCVTVLVLYFVVVVRECDSCFGGVHVTVLVWYFVITVRLRLVRKEVGKSDS